MMFFFLHTRRHRECTRDSLRSFISPQSSIHWGPGVGNGSRRNELSHSPQRTHWHGETAQIGNGAGTGFASLPSPPVLWFQITCRTRGGTEVHLGYRKGAWGGMWGANVWGGGGHRTVIFPSTHLVAKNAR